MKRHITATVGLVAALAAFAVGMWLGDATQPFTGTDRCATALSRVVEVIEAEWATASEAVDRAAAAIEAPEVRSCVAEVN